MKKCRKKPMAGNIIGTNQNDSSIELTTTITTTNTTTNTSTANTVVIVKQQNDLTVAKTILISNDCQHHSSLTKVLIFYFIIKNISMANYFKFSISHLFVY